jgi:hypothetical protein
MGVIQEPEKSEQGAVRGNILLTGRKGLRSERLT